MTYLEERMQVDVMFGVVFPRDEKIICDYLGALSSLDGLMHLPLPDFRCAGNAKWHTLPSVASKQRVECCEST